MSKGKGLDKLTEQDVKFSGRFSPQVLQTLWFSYRQYGLTLFILLFFGLGGRILLLGNANVIGIWVDQFCRPTDFIQCRPIPAYFTHFNNQQFIHFLLGLTLAGFFMTIIFRVGFSILSAKAVSQIYDETTYRTSRFPMSFFDNTPAGRIVTRFSSDYGNVFRLFGGPLAEFLSIIFDMICMIVLIFLASPVYMPAVVVVAVINYILYRTNRSRLRTARRELSASRSPSIAHFSETVQGASTIRSFNKEKNFSDRFKFLDQFFLERKKIVVRNVTFFSVQISFLTATLLLSTGAVASVLVRTGGVSVGSIGVAFGFIMLSGNTIQMFFEWLVQFEEAMIGVERMDQYLRKPIELGSHLPARRAFPTEHWVDSFSPKTGSTQSASPKTVAQVEFRNVWFRYADNLPYILKDISFTVKSGERLGIVGRTGSGKSSLIQALFSLYPIDRGQILIDGEIPELQKPGGPVTLEKFRSHLSFIAQDPSLFKGSLRHNLDIENKFSNEMLIRALEQVGLHEFANEAGLRYDIEERGKNLSLGEKQLICMARCLLLSSPIVIMDEATSSIDPRSEEILTHATDEFFKGRTQIIIAHRLSTLEKCDRILWLQDGTVKMIGTPQKIIPQFEKSNLSL